MAKKKTSNKLCPDRQFFYEPTLKALDMLGGSGSNGEIYKKVLEITNLITYRLVPPGCQGRSFKSRQARYRLDGRRGTNQQNGRIWYWSQRSEIV